MKSTSVIVFAASLVFLGIVFSESRTCGGLRTDDEIGVSTTPHKADVLPPGTDNFPVYLSEDRSTRWFYSAAPGGPNGVSLVIHGLNLKPDKMLSIISGMTESGIDVLLLSLRGHGDNYGYEYSYGHENSYAHEKINNSETARLEAFKTVSYQLWLNEAYLAYLEANKRAEKIGIPLFLNAFSLGGLIGLDLFASKPDVKFDRMVLFAPAIALRLTIYLERALSFFPRLVIPSLAPKAYLANKKGTPIAAYNALFEGLYQFKKNAGPELNVPTLIFIDEQDEFIPLWKLKKMVEENGWNQWQFYIVHKEKQVQAGETFHHHIIDASSTGNAVWQNILKTVNSHLLYHIYD
jgi:pimeloyl-ACP methyl ester carboxylesterase